MAWNDKRVYLLNNIRLLKGVGILINNNIDGFLGLNKNTFLEVSLLFSIG